MSTYTQNLNLFEYDTSTDGAQVFSIDDALNENFDKIDNFAGEMATYKTEVQKSLSTINTTLGKKLEADVLLAENGYIKFNNGLLINYGNRITNGTNTLPCAYITYYCIVTGNTQNRTDGNTATYNDISTWTGTTYSKTLTTFYSRGAGYYASIGF